MADTPMLAGSHLAGIVPEIWSSKFYPTLLENLPFAASLGYDYNSEIQKLGDTVHIATFPQFSPAEDLAEDGVGSAVAITEANADLVVNHQLALDFIITNYVKYQAIDAGNKLRELALHAIKEKMEEILIADIVPSSSPDHTLDYTTPGVFTLADMIRAKRLLDDQSVPDVGQRVMIGGANVANQILSIAGFVSRDFIPAGSPLTTGSVATPLLGFQFKWTAKILDDAAYLFSPEFLQIGVQQSPVPVEYDLGGEGKRQYRVNLTALMGNKQVDDKRIATLT